MLSWVPMTNGRTNSTALHSHAGFTLTEMMVVVAFMGTIAAIAIPVIASALASMRLNGSIRSISNDAAAVKTKAGAQFTRSRMYFDLGANSYHRETWDQTAGQWLWDNGPELLPANVTFNFGPVATPPQNTQPTPPGISQAPACMDSAAPPAPIANTACFVFNSRGIPIDALGVPTNRDAVYITDGTTVKAVTVSSTGLLGVWSTPSLAAPLWGIS